MPPRPAAGYAAFCARLATLEGHSPAGKIAIAADVAWAQGKDREGARATAIDAIAPLSGIRDTRENLERVWRSRWKLLEHAGP